MALFSGKPLIGMVHMPALPGAPANDHSIAQLVEFALSEIEVLEGAGLDGAIVENVGDTPFFRDRVPALTTAAMTAIVHEAKKHTSLRVGVNILRNGCEEALSVAHASGADFIRCNVVTGAYVTDQGIIQGCAAELARLRVALDRDIDVFGDVHVKHSYPLFNVPIEDAARDLAERGGVDAVIVSGARSPDPPMPGDLKVVQDVVDLPVLVGSGVGLHNAAELYQRSGGLILGEVDFKLDRRWGGPSNADAYKRAVESCRN